MIKTLILSLLLIFITYIPPVAAQRATSQDYFTADEFPNIKALLQSVDHLHTNPAENYVFRGDMNSAIADLRYTLDTFPNHPRALLLIGTASKIKKIPSLGISFFKRAITLYPQYAITYIQYGAFLLDIDQTVEGIEILKKAIEIDAKVVFAYELLTKAYIKNGQAELARQVIEQARELGLNVEMPGVTQDKQKK
jgi:tetratricopeptide (TPR) repeat protein